MNYSVAGFQVDCLVKNFVKSLLGAIYAVKIISMALIYRMKEVEGILCQNLFHTQFPYIAQLEEKTLRNIQIKWFRKFP